VYGEPFMQERRADVKAVPVAAEILRRHQVVEKI
jgi:hypothetical protein